MMGVGLLYHLAEEVWKDVLLIEKGELSRKRRGTRELKRQVVEKPISARCRRTCATRAS